MDEGSRRLSSGETKICGHEHRHSDIVHSLGVGDGD